MDFLDRYIAYTQHQVSPEIYHRWVALTILGAAMERRCWLTRGYEDLRIYPGQLMVVLVGRSALAKKTTAMNMGAGLLKKLPPWQVNVLPEQTSPQQLLADLARLDEEGLGLRYPEEAGELAGRRLNSSGLILASELGNYFSADSWNERMATQVADLNDAPMGRKEIKFKKYSLRLWNPLVTMMGCVTPKGIAAELPKAARTAGFFGRVIWVYAGGTDRANSLTDPVPDEAAIRAELIQGLKRIATMYGPFGFTTQGKAWFDGWYYDEYVPHLKRMDALQVADASGYWGRKDGLLLRVAMACSAARSWGMERYLRRVDLERALGYLVEIERGLPEAMAEIGVGAAQLEENSRVLSFIERAGERALDGYVPMPKLYQYANKLGFKKFHLDDCIARLRASGDIDVQWLAGAQSVKRLWSHGGLVRRAMEEGAGKLVLVKKEGS